MNIQGITVIIAFSIAACSSPTSTVSVSIDAATGDHEQTTETPTSIEDAVGDVAAPIETSDASTEDAADTKDAEIDAKPDAMPELDTSPEVGPCVDLGTSTGECLGYGTGWEQWSLCASAPKKGCDPTLGGAGAIPNVWCCPPKA